MICEIAVATHTHPGPWWQESTETLLTVVTIFEEQARAADKSRKRR